MADNKGFMGRGFRLSVQGRPVNEPHSHEQRRAGR